MRVAAADGGIEIPVLGMGTWCFGGRTEHDPGNDDAGQIAVLQQGIEMGFGLIDTAEYYAAGYAETLVGKAIRGVDRRRLFITSKVWKSNASKENVLRACENTLKRLGCDYLDCYLYHHYNPEIPLEETMGALNELVEQGMTRSIGVSNFSAALLQKAMEYSSVPVVMNQVHCNLAVREAQENLETFCRENGVIFQAWRPVRDLESTPECAALCAKYGITFQQLALAWLLNHEGFSVITAMKNPRHLAETMAAPEIKFEEEEMALLNDYPFRRPCGVALA